MVTLGNRKNETGFSLVEVLVVIGITVLIFGALFVSFEYSLKLIAQSRAKMTGLSLAADRMEYLRSLPYNSVGTVSGIPNGAIPQNRIVKLNGIDFAERVLIEYMDDPADGLGILDSNSIVADYKIIKVEYSWDVYGVPKSFSLIGTIVPKSIETTAGGGTLRVNVFDASVLPLSGINVRLINNTTTSTIDVTKATDATGVAYFTGAPASAGYEIFVSAAGYSTDQTRQATTSLPYPTTLPVTVLVSDVSTMNFQVDRLSDLTVNVFDSQTTISYIELFDDLLGVVSSSSVAASSGSLSLAETAGVYDLTGSVMLAPITPTPIVSWGVAEVEKLIPSATDVRVRFYSSTSTSSLISESDLPGNLAGFTGKYVDLSNLELFTYPTLVVGIELSTTNSAVTPEVKSLKVHHYESRNMLSGTPLTMKGNRVIGADAIFASVYKNDFSTTTNLSGKVVFNDIEWDSYTVTLGGGLVVREACSANPFFLNPDSNRTINLLTAPATANNLRVAVRAGDGSPIIGANVKLSLTPSVWNSQTSWCGQTYFGGLSNSSSYELEVSALGYSTSTMSSTTISGTTIQEVILVP